MSSTANPVRPATCLTTSNVATSLLFIDEPGAKAHVDQYEKTEPDIQIDACRLVSWFKWYLERNPTPSSGLLMPSLRYGQDRDLVPIPCYPEANDVEECVVMPVHALT